ncbi:MAG: DUF3078 domain-containing protein [Marinilabilia sp.]
MRIKAQFLFLLIIFLSSTAKTQTPEDTVQHWKSGAITSLTFSQISLTNWSGGGNSSVSGTFSFRSFLNYTKDNNEWENTLDIGYGLTQQGTENFVKSEDRLQFVSKYGRKASEKWFYTALFDFKTQFDKGYKDPPENTNLTSRFMAPAYILLSLGMDYKADDNFSLYLSPVTGKVTIVNDDELSEDGAYGVEQGENIRSEFGTSLKSVYEKENIIENVDFRTHLDLFSNLSNHPERIDVEWDAKFDFKVNSFLSANAGTTIIYDHDINYIDNEGIEHGPRVQFKQLFGFGINYKF